MRAICRNELNQNFTCNFCSISASFLAVSTGLAAPNMAGLRVLASDSSLLSGLSDLLLSCSGRRSLGGSTEFNYKIIYNFVA